MKKIFVAIMVAICAIACTGCSFNKMTDEEIERRAYLELYAQVTGKNGEDLSITQMKRDLMKTELEKEHACYWTFEGTEFDRVQTVHTYLDDGTRFYIVYDLDMGSPIEYGVED